MKIQSPCYKCGERTEYGMCHMTCERYIEYNNTNIKDSKDRYEYNKRRADLDDFRFEGYFKKK